MPGGPAKSWSSTLRLPKSTFPVRPITADRPKYLKRCTDNLYAWQAENCKGSPPFVLHDGPPYANGDLHVGHALNKILKDMICRAELHQGRRVKYVPGWDCHGLPIEIKALEQQRQKTDGVATLDAIGVRRIARNLATRTVEKQKKGFREWAIMADWDNAWTTKDKDFELKQLRVFQEMARRGIIFRRYKPVYWSPSSRTALAEAELEYKDDHESTAAYIKFPITTISRVLREQGADMNQLSAVAWTTTPWTLPSNRAIAIHPELKYIVIGIGGEQLLIAETRLEHMAKYLSVDPSGIEVIARINGVDLEGTQYRNVLRGAESDPQQLLLAEFVSAESGSGLVHCAPGHGMEDYDICKKMGIEAFAPVDDAGCFTDAAFPDNPVALVGHSVLVDGSEKVLQLLGDKVLAVHKYTHKYPYDWRTKLPVIVRATEQWFADVGSIKDIALASLKDVDFIPESGRSRLESFVMGRSEWCISRQRAWGVPIPALYNEKGEAILTDESVAHIISVIGERGSDAWWADAEDDPVWIAPGLEGYYRRGKDTMDVWFDSGTSWTQTNGQADVYCEGTDQHRGWFQSSLLTHLSASGLEVSPFRKCITHGFTLDQEGRKMSKSIGNIIAPAEIMEGRLLPPIKIKGKATPSFDGLGPDALRLWVASSDYTRDVVIGQPVLKAINLSLIKYRTTIKMLLGSLHAESLHQPLTILDKIALVRLDAAITEVRDAWKTYEFHKAVTAINRWVNVDLSSFYLEGAKDRLYCGDGGGVIYHAFMGLLKMLAPITPLLVEEAWEYRPQWMKDDPSHSHPLQQSLFFPTSASDSSSPLSIPRTNYASLAPAIPPLLAANRAIKTAQESARAQKLIGSSLQSSVMLVFNSQAAKKVFEPFADELESVFVVSNVRLQGPGDGGKMDWKEEKWVFEAEFEVSVPEDGNKGEVRVEKAMAVVIPPTEEICGRCWRYKAPEPQALCERCESVLGLKSGGVDGV